MRSNILRALCVAVMVAVSCGVAVGQQLPERKHIRRGNKLYEQQRMAEAEKEYRKALQLDSMSVEGLFNLGDAQYASGAFEAAEGSFKSVAERKSGVTDQQRAAAYYNLGNSQFQQQKLQEALASFKESLKLNPGDLEAKFNYAYTKAMLDNQQNNQNQNQDQNQNNNQNQSGQNNQDQQQNQDNNNQQQNSNGGEQPPQQGEQPEHPEGEKPKPSEQGQQPEQGPRKESEQMLNAVQQAENRTREKVDDQL
ncbi:MAG: tetratricopeptide repeat protein [Tidjanibacter sp.]|nr:tetratricopeptide repeat protein [Tidjanibacter sp.]